MTFWRAEATLAALLVTLFLPPPSASALSCAASHSSIFPPPGEIPANPRFVIQGDASYAGKAVRAFQDNFAEFFTEETEEGPERAYPTRIVERSDAYLSYVVVAPVAPLPRGRIGLRIRWSFEGTEPRWVNQGWWTVGADPDETAPMLIGETDSMVLLPRVGDSSWGRSVSVEFPVSATESPILLLASVEESEDGAPLGNAIELFLYPRGYTLYTGPCGRNHELTPGKQYLVDLVPIDSAGNRGRALEQKFSFEAP